MASAVSNINDDILTIPECCTECRTEENEVPAMVTYQFIQCDDQKTELVIGKQISLPNDHSNSELIIGHN